MPRLPLDTPAAAEQLAARLRAYLLSRVGRGLSATLDGPHVGAEQFDTPDGFLLATPAGPETLTLTVTTDTP